MTLTPEELAQVFDLVGAAAAMCGFVGYAVSWLSFKLLEGLEGLLRRRGARAPFAERAARYERMKVRLFHAVCRIQERNQREAARRG